MRAKKFYGIFFGIIGIKLLLAYFLPIISDEAYFYVWGQHPSFNYYDHPPMTGWIVYLFSLLGHHIFFDRLFAIFSGAFVALGIEHIVRNRFQAPDKARWVSLAFLVSPLHLLLVPITTDTPLFLFLFISGACFHGAVTRDRHPDFLLSGIFLGLAVLSKYFAGLLLVAYSVYLLVNRRHLFKGGALLLTGMLPFVLLHLYWNYNDCWTNLMFNVINRNQNVHLTISKALSFVGFQLYLVSPWAFYYLVKNRKNIRQTLARTPNPFLYLFLVPIVILGLISFHNTGLHWVIGFYPFFYLLLTCLPKAELIRIVQFSTVFGLIHILILGAVLSQPVERFRNFPYYHDLVLCKYGNEIDEKIIRTYGTDYVPATNGYYTSAAMTYNSGRPYIVFMDYSKHGRLDDKLTDYRKLDGNNILILATLPIPHDYRPFFDKVKIETLRVRQNDFFVALGTGFHYAAYRDQFLRKILTTWYRIPDFLPMGDCYFCDRYFPELKHCGN